MSLQELRSCQDYVTVVVSTCWFCTENQRMCLGQDRKGRLRRSSPSTLSDSALCHSDLSWGFTEVTGPGFWVAWKNRQMVDHLSNNHPWLLAVLTCFRFISWKLSFFKIQKKKNPSPLLFMSWKRVTSTGTAALWRSAACSISKPVSLFTSLAILTWNRCTSWALLELQETCAAYTKYILHTTNKVSARYCTGIRKLDLNFNWLQSSLALSNSSAVYEADFVLVLFLPSKESHLTLTKISNLYSEV